jgi:hypothetical protein
MTIKFHESLSCRIPAIDCGHKGGTMDGREGEKGRERDRVTKDNKHEHVLF